MAHSLAQDRIVQLSGIGFKWTLKEAVPHWNARFKELLTYKSEHGDCNVPKRQGKLGRWVGGQRKSYMAGSLPQDRIDRLNIIGFKWALKEAVSTVPWDTRFEELIKYKAEHGDCDIPQTGTAWRVGKKAKV